MKLTKLLLFLASISAVVVSSAGSALAGSKPADLSVKVNVKNNCTITTTDVLFSDYDPTTGVSVNETQGAVNITCSKGSVTPIDLDLGANYTSTQRRMKGPGTTGSEYLNYQLFSNASRNTVWGSGTSNFTPAASSSSTTPVAVRVYGTIAASQDVSVGAYSDTVVATVNF
jgi:spore coat protein U-like protein